MPVEFTVPLFPPSVNHIYLPCRYTGRDGYTHTGRKLTKEAKAFKEAVALFARRQTVAPESDRDRRKAKYRVVVDLHFGPRQRLDSDNAGKLLLDALQGAGVIHSDTHVDFHVIPHKDDRQNPLNPRTIYYVELMEIE